LRRDELAGVADGSRAPYRSLPMDMNAPEEARLIALEMQLAETQRALELLDEVVVGQADRVEGLEEELRTLRSALAAIARRLRDADEEPAG
jgi:uncharacterized coiled-coil protein SlyX